LSSRGVRYNENRALEGLCYVEKIQNNDALKKYTKPLVKILRSKSEKKKKVVINALTKLSFENIPDAISIADTEGDLIEGLHRVLENPCCLQLKESISHIFYVLLKNLEV
jgi:hypothetical protein